MDRNSPPVPFGRSQPGRASFLTYELYYGLKEKPFSLSADPKFLYRSPSHAATYDDLLLGIRRREGLIVLTGDIGTGKTTLCRAVLENLDRKTFSAFVPDPFVSREDLLKMLLIDFGVMSVDDLKSGRLSGVSRPDLSYPLYEFLNSLVPLQAFAVLIIDEAQNLPIPLLEEIRILSDLEAPEKLLQVVLVGQLEFRSKLKLPEMRQLDQRVSVRCGLEPLNRDGVAGYIAHRLQVAGGTPNRIAFADEAVDLIYLASRGVPRLINLICDRALTRGSLWRESRIDPEVVTLAVADLGVGELRQAPAVEHKAPEPRIADRDVKSPYQESPVLVSAPVEADEPELLQSFSAGATKAEVQLAGRRRRMRQLIAALGVIAAVILLMFWGQRQMLFRASQPAEPPLLPDVAPAPLPTSLPAQINPVPNTALPASAVPSAPVPELSNGAASPGERRYAIDVALFDSSRRADRLVQELAAAGYSTYQVLVDLGPVGQRRLVLVGNYVTEPDAETDLARIRQIPGYSDARIISAPRRLP